ncbi:hypothetical protein O3G_MSEX006065 [Manduca sexta]|uniref:Uncharacterized protein n=1 Tax=Manduca sexta TaxID=7130 RepID=A0A921Z0V1_MANSE|nr:hypothetical protein O3G_MSEX006065 [Manduca sexta]
MCDIKPIKSIIFLENLLCIYRNYTFYRDKEKKLRLFRVIVEIIVNMAITIADITVKYNHFEKKIWTFFLVILKHSILVGYSIFCIINAILHKDSFKELVDTFDKIHKNLNKDVTHNRFLTRLNIKCILVSVVYIIIVSVDSIYDQKNVNYYDQPFYFIMMFVGAIIVKSYRLSMEYLVYSIFVTILHKLCKRLNYLLDEMQTKLHESIMEDGNISDEIDLKIIEESAEMYGDLFISSKAIRKCFCAQV